MRRVPIIVLVLMCGGSVASGAPGDDAAQAADQTVARAAVLPTEVSRHSEQATDLDARDEALWLGEGDNRFFAVRRASVAAETVGTFVLVRNRASGPDAPDRLGYLREMLPRLGWTTIVLDLPDAPDAAVPSRDRERMPPLPSGLRTGRTPTADPTKSPEDTAAAPKPAKAEESPAKTEEWKATCFTEGSDPSVKHLCDTADRERILRRLATAAQAPGNAQPVIMLGEGEAAAWVARANGATPVAAAVVALNIDDPGAPFDGEETSHWFEALTVPALVMQEAPRPWSPDVRLNDSTELRLMPTSRPSGEERLLRHLRGWLERRQSG